MEHVGNIAYHIVCMKITHMVETTILHMIHIGGGKIEDITTTQHCLDHHIQTVISKTFTIGDQPSQVFDFIIFIHMSIPIMLSHK